MAILVGFWVAVGAVSGAQQWLVSRGDASSLSMADALGHQIVSALPWIPISLGIVLLVSRVPVGRGNTARALIIHVLAAVLTAVVANLAIAGLLRMVGSPFVSPQPYLLDVWNNTLRWAHVVVVVYAVIAGAAHIWLGRLRPSESRPDQTQTGPAKFAPLTLKEGSTTRIVRPETIQWLQADGDYVRVHCDDGEFLVNHRLAELADRLSGAGFVRIHRSTLVHPSRIRSVRPVGRGDREATLLDGTTVRVSRRRAAELRDVLLRIGDSGPTGQLGRE